MTCSTQSGTVSRTTTRGEDNEESVHFFTRLCDVGEARRGL